MVRYLITNSDGREKYGVFSSLEEAEESIKDFENNDKKDGIFEPGYYSIIPL